MVADELAAAAADYNFDHPDAIDAAALRRCMQDLRVSPCIKPGWCAALYHVHQQKAAGTCMCCACCSGASMLVLHVVLDSHTLSMCTLHSLLRNC